MNRFLAFYILLISGCASSQVEKITELGQLASDVYIENLKGDYAQWADHKALAFAVDEKGRFEMGYAVNARTSERAAENALIECGRRAGWRQVEDKCQLYAVDDEWLITTP